MSEVDVAIAILKRVESNVKSINDTLNGAGAEVGLKGQVDTNKKNIDKILETKAKRKTLHTAIILGCLSIIITELVHKLVNIF